MVTHAECEETLRAVSRGCVVTHTVRKETLCIVRRRCVVTYAVREKTLGVIRHGCVVIHTVREENLGAVRRWNVVTHTFSRGTLVFLHAVRRRLKICSVVLLPALKLVCSSAMIFSACGFNLFSMIFSITLLG